MARTVPSEKGHRSNKRLVPKVRPSAAPPRQRARYQSADDADFSLPYTDFVSDPRPDRPEEPAPEVHIAPVESRDAWHDAKALRQRVFIDEQDCPPEEEFDAHDAESRHLLARVEAEAVGVARWRAVHLEDGEPAAKLERFAVAQAHRGRGYGRALVRRAIREAERAGFSTQFVHAQAHLEDFYAAFGFERRGEPFDEVGIAHVAMVRRS